MDSVAVQSEDASQSAEGWSHEAVETVKRMWAEGKSGSEIGAEVGKTRNAVISKVHRLNLSPRETVEQASGGMPIPAEPPIPRPPIPPQPEIDDEDDDDDDSVTINRSADPLEQVRKGQHVPVPQALRAPDGSEGVLLMKAGTFQCRYPLWADDTPIEEKRVCGCSVKTGKSWCQTHYNKVFDTLRRR